MGVAIDDSGPARQAVGAFLDCRRVAGRHSVAGMGLRVEVPADSAAVEEFVRFHDRVYAGPGRLLAGIRAPRGPLRQRHRSDRRVRRCRPFVARDGSGAIVARVLAVLDTALHPALERALGHWSSSRRCPTRATPCARLMDRACEWLATQGAEAARCGMGPLDMPFVIDAYDTLPPSILRFNPPYYHALLKDAGFETEQGYVDYRIAVRPELVARWEAAVTAAERRGVELVPLRAVPAERRAALLASLFNETFAAALGLRRRSQRRSSNLPGPVRGDRRPRHVDDRLPRRRAPGRGDGGAGQQRLRQGGARPRPARRASGSTGSASACVRRRVGAAWIWRSPRPRFSSSCDGAPRTSATRWCSIDNWPSRRTAERLGAEVCANYVAYRRNLRR